MKSTTRDRAAPVFLTLFRPRADSPSKVPAHAPREKISGGFSLVNLALALEVWKAYRTDRAIDFADVRAWFGLVEQVERRRAHDSSTRDERNRLGLRDPAPSFGPDELRKLVGGRSARAVARSVRRLEAAELVVANADSIVFPKRPGPWVPIPRRVVRMLARSDSRPAFVATLLGHAVRCLRRKERLVHSVGLAPVRWIAETFGIGERAVELARARLFATGLLFKRGKAIAFNLDWDETADVRASTVSSTSRVREVAPADPGVCASPYNVWFKEPFQENCLKPRTRSPDARTGFQDAPDPPVEKPVERLPIRPPGEVPAPAIAAELERSAPVPVPVPAEVVAAVPSAHASIQPRERPTVPPVPVANGLGSPRRIAPLPPLPRERTAADFAPGDVPKLDDVSPGDLRDPGRLDVLYRQAAARGLVRPSEHARHEFAAAAEHASRVADKPGALFAADMRGKVSGASRPFGFTTDADELKAHADLKAHQYPPSSLVREARKIELAPRRVEISKDAETIRFLNRRGIALRTARNALTGRGWTAERFDAARAEYLRFTGRVDEGPTVAIGAPLSRLADATERLSGSAILATIDPVPASAERPAAVPAS